MTTREERVLRGIKLDLEESFTGQGMVECATSEGSWLEKIGEIFEEHGLQKEDALLVACRIKLPPNRHLSKQLPFRIVFREREGNVRLWELRENRNFTFFVDEFVTALEEYLNDPIVKALYQRS